MTMHACHFISLYVSVQFSHSVVSDSLWPHWLQHTSLPVHHHLPELAQTHIHWVGDAIQWSHPLSSPSPPAFNLSQHWSLQMSQFFASGGHSIGTSASASVLPLNIQDWFPLGLMVGSPCSLLQSPCSPLQGLSRVFFNTTVQRHQFFGAQLSL